MDYQYPFKEQNDNDPGTVAPVFTPVSPPPGLSVVRSLLLMLLVFVGTVDAVLLVVILRAFGII